MKIFENLENFLKTWKSLKIFKNLLKTWKISNQKPGKILKILKNSKNIEKFWKNLEKSLNFFEDFFRFKENLNAYVRNFGYFEYYRVMKML